MSMNTSGNNHLCSCANCGKGEDESLHLKECAACKMIKYCNRDCQVAHRPQHKKACKKRAAELYDEKLFKQPPPSEDCPICMLPLPSLHSGHRYKSCCGKNLCSGCIIAVQRRDSAGLCPFCRVPTPCSDQENAKRLKHRMKVDDAEAIFHIACYYFGGRFGFPQDIEKSIKLWHQAAELGSAGAFFSIGNAYLHGSGVERDEEMAKHYWGLAAMGGDVSARQNLGVHEYNAGNMDRALKHYMIAAGMGCTGSLENIKRMFMNGEASKDDYSKALRVYQAYLNEIKSPQRDEAAALNEQFKYCN